MGMGIRQMRVCCDSLEDMVFDAFCNSGGEFGIFSHSSNVLEIRFEEFQTKQKTVIKINVNCCGQPYLSVDLSTDFVERE